TIPSASVGGSGNGVSGGPRLSGSRYQREMPATMRRAANAFRLANESGRVTRPITEPLAMATLVRTFGRQGPEDLPGPDDTFDPPTNAAYLQAESLDRQFATYRATSRIDRDSLPEQIILDVEIVGVRSSIPVKFPLDRLRRALGIPDVCLRSAFDERMSARVPSLAPHDDLPDIDHPQPLEDHRQQHLALDHDDDEDEEEVLVRRYHPSNKHRSMRYSSDDEVHPGIEISSFDDFPRVSAPHMSTSVPPAIEVAPVFTPKHDDHKPKQRNAITNRRVTR
ncbi:hypothetical protein BGX23_003665, partial [Mortierella sp. AD031]